MTVPHAHIFGFIAEHKLIKLFYQVQVISDCPWLHVLVDFE